jgi:hypothetical protein
LIAFMIMSGMSFSGHWKGPKLLEQLVTITGSPKVLCQARTRWSAEALLAE